MVWTELSEGLAAALGAAGLYRPERMARLELAVPRESAHGDWTTNLALIVARETRRPPREVAQAIAAAFPLDPALFAPVEVAGPGFLNFRYSDAFLDALPGRIVAAGPAFGASAGGGGRRVLVEYVSANPTGPLNIVSARAAAVGATLVRLLRATGHEALGEFYVNDAGRQVELLGESLAARFGERIGSARPFPDEGYQGEYLKDIAAELPEDEARRALLEPDHGAAWFRDQALERMVREQRRDLDEYGAEFARWFHESELHRSGAVDETLRALEARGMTYRAVQPETGEGGADEGPAPAASGAEAVWLRTSRCGDSTDRVIVRSNGVPTYLLPDLAYHRDKRVRGYDVAIDLWGPDHHAYVTTMKAALAALGVPPEFLEVLIVQQVNLWQTGPDGAREQVKMSKRRGRLVTLRDLMEDVGADCARFLFLLRSTNAHLDFDLDEARARNDENPAYYVQMAHARICSILRFAAQRGLAPEDGAPTRLAAPRETALVRKLAVFPEVVRGAAATREPHRLPVYLVETAAELHRFHHDLRVVSPDPALSRSRLRLMAAARVVFANGLALMGVTAPERMERAAEEIS
ncbi:MAG TPA: arginine--tRNA ligase [Terriglobales bacterium]|nr:arginine--tRNA ligase [Terriglobales bacterium]